MSLLFGIDIIIFKLLLLVILFLGCLLSAFSAQFATNYAEYVAMINQKITNLYAFI